MLIQTKLIFLNEKETELIGKPAWEEEKVVVCLDEVTAIMPKGDDASTLFTAGGDLTVLIPFPKLYKLFLEAKGYKETTPLIPYEDER